MGLLMTYPDAWLWVYNGLYLRAPLALRGERHSYILRKS
jgi:hypothetical protein